MNRLEAINTFQEGMVMDFNPLTTPKNVLTSCLNGTILTFNGNEYVLLNDMGNGRVETAYLPEGYVPVGTTELGGIIYIVSYNPIIKKCLIGSFPSPERNISQDRSGELLLTISNNDFYEGDTDDIKTPIVIKKLVDFTINPGDKFIVCGNSILDNKDNISYYIGKDIKRKYIDLKLATIDSNGRLIYLDNLRTYDEGTVIKNGNISDINSDVDDYRSVVQSDYQIFPSKIAGNLYLAGLLEVVDSFQTLSWNLIEITDNPPSDAIVFDFGSGKYYGIEYTIEFSSVNNNKAIGVKLVLGSDSSYIEQDTNNPNLFKKVVYYRIDPTNGKNNNVETIFIPVMEFGNLVYMQEKVNIDFSLLGTNTITNTVWKYYKDTNSMQIKYNLQNNYINDNISKIEICIEDMFDSSKKINPTIPDKKTYSGNNSLIIPFDENFRENSFFKVIIKATMEKNKLESEIVHYMYTNGVFNEYWLSLENDKLDFDNIYLPLKPTISIEGYLQGIPITYENILDSNLISLENRDHFRGKTVYTAFGEKPVKIKCDFVNDFNTFSLEGLNPTAEINNTTSTITSKIVNSLDGMNVDDQYITSTDELYNDEIIDITLNENIFSYNIKLYSPISANSQFKRVPIQDYYAPIVLNEYDFNKYRINVELSDTGVDSINLLTYGPALGMSGGGRDNQGGGGLYYVCGDADISAFEDDNATQYPFLFISGSAEPDFPEEGKPGISKFPNLDMSDVISRSNPNGGLIPVILINAGTSKIRYKGVLYRFLGSENYGKDTKRAKAFNSDMTTLLLNPTSFVYLLVFVRIKESEDFVPLNYFLKLQLTPSREIECSNLQKYYSLLCNLYAKRPFSDTIGIYTVKDISYVDKFVSVSCDVNAEATYVDDNLRYNGNKLPDIKLNCVKLNPKNILNGKLKLNNAVVFKFDISNKYYDTYREYEMTSVLPKYVYGNLIPPDDLDYDLYINKDGKLIKPSKSEFLPLYSNLQLSEDGKLIGVPANSKYEYTNLNILSYDMRNDTICINNKDITYSLPLTWSSHEDKNRDITTIISEKIDPASSITSLEK